jgi:hypothetical protein
MRPDILESLLREILTSGHRVGQMCSGFTTFRDGHGTAHLRTTKPS